MTSALAEKIGALPASHSITTFSMYLFGDSGAGKTYLSATAQDDKSTAPVLFLDVEGGTATIRNRADIEVVQVRSVNQLASIHGDLHSDAGKTYKTVVIDSLSELQKLDMQEIMNAAAAKDRDSFHPQHGTRNIDVPSPREWGMTLMHMRKIVRAYKDLPCNVIMTALAVKTTDESTGAVTVMPAMQGRALLELPAFFDVVAYLDTIIEKDNVDRRLIVGSTPKYKTKDRLGVDDPQSPGLVMNPTVPKLWENLNSQNTKDSK